MRQPTLQDQVDAARAYEALFVPALFAQWTPLVAAAARIRAGQRVLDVASGTGVLAREAALRAGPTGYVVGLDPSPGMISVARELAPAVEWHEGSAEQLPFPDQFFDAVVSQFGLMFFADRNRALREMCRVLVAKGQLAIAVWDAVETMPAYQAEVTLVERLAGSKAAAALRAPFALGSVDTLSATFSAAGISSVDITTHTGTAKFPSVRTMVEADLRGWLPVMGVNLTEDLIRCILDEAETVLGCFASADGRAEFPLSAHLAAAAAS